LFDQSDDRKELNRQSSHEAELPALFQISGINAYPLSPLLRGPLFERKRLYVCKRTNVRKLALLLRSDEGKERQLHIHLGRPPAIRLVHFGLGEPDVPMDQLALCPCFYASD
jgi:hypothetical protein